MPRQTFDNAMRRLCEIQPSPPVLAAALSGGVDSVVLLHLLAAWHKTLAAENKPRLLALHLNHGLRGEAARGDQAFCREYATELGVPFATADQDVARFAKVQRLGLEEAGRLLRQRFFAEYAGSDGLLLTGHHAGDQVETILMRLHRGAHRRGLAGMREYTVINLAPERRLRLGRPLLGVERADLMAYALEKKLAWREDASNASDAFFRNRIRHRLAPLLENWLPGFGGRLRARAEGWAEEERSTGEAADAWLRGHCRRENGGCFVSAAGGDSGVGFGDVSDEVLRHALRRIYEEEAGRTVPDGGVLARILALAQTGRLGGTQCLPGGIRVRKEHDGLFFFRAAPRAVNAANQGGTGDVADVRLTEFHETPLPETPLPVAGEVILPEPPFRVRHDGLVISAEYRRGRPPLEDCLCPGVEWLKLAALRFPLCLRPPRSGERMVPLGGSGSRKIQDLLVDGKIPRRKRMLARVLADGEGCLWLWPLRLAERARVGSEGDLALRVVIGGELECGDNCSQ